MLWSGGVPKRQVHENSPVLERKYAGLIKSRVGTRLPQILKIQAEVYQRRARLGRCRPKHPVWPGFGTSVGGEIDQSWPDAFAKMGPGSTNLGGRFRLSFARHRPHLARLRPRLERFRPNPGRSWSLLRPCIGRLRPASAPNSPKLARNGPLSRSGMGQARSMYQASSAVFWANRGG